MELMNAHRQWATRPADQRYSSIAELLAATRAYAEQTRPAPVKVGDLHMEVINNDLALVGKTKQPAQLTSWAMNQLANKVGAPVQWLRQCSPQLAADNLNEGLTRYADKREDANLLVERNGSLLVRAVLSPIYSRIWNYEVAERMLALEPYGWKPARPDIRVSMGDFPALYASHEDMFAFLMNDSYQIRDSLTGKFLKLGVIVENSEVGKSKIRLTKFKYYEMCGNHIIWGAQGVMEIAARHVGNVQGKISNWEFELKKYLDSTSPSLEEAKIKTAQSLRIADTKEGVLDKLFSIRSLNLSRKTLEGGYDAALPHQDGSPNTVWGMVQGLTRYSQTLPYTDIRTEVDRSAGKLMEMAF